MYTRGRQMIRLEVDFWQMTLTILAGFEFDLFSKKWVSDYIKKVFARVLEKKVQDYSITISHFVTGKNEFQKRAQTF